MLTNCLIRFVELFIYYRLVKYEAEAIPMNPSFHINTESLKNIPLKLIKF